MRAGWLLLFAFFVAADATSQTSIGVVTGIVSDPEGAPFANAFVQLTATGASSPAANAVSGADGRYTLTAVATGTYELAVNVPGMKSFTRSNLVLTTGATLRVDARLEDGPSLRTIGEDPATIAAVFINRPPPPDGPTPRTANGKPDTLVIDSIGFRDRGWIDFSGHARSSMLHVSQRLTRTDQGSPPLRATRRTLCTLCTT